MKPGSPDRRCIAATTLLFIAQCMLLPRAWGDLLSSVTFENKSGEEALVKLVGPTSQAVQVPNGQSRSVKAAAGKYYILVRYSIELDKFRYTKGEPFDVEEKVTAMSTQYSETTITLHPVVAGNYSTKPSSKDEFEKAAGEVLSSPAVFAGAHTPDKNAQPIAATKSGNVPPVQTTGSAQEAAKQRFVDNGNGTVSDRKTGLMWQKEDDGTMRSYDQAVAYCKELRLGGFTDWRLPKPWEVTAAIKQEFYRKPRKGSESILSYEQVRMFRSLGVQIQGADRYWTDDPNDIALFNLTPPMDLHTTIKVSREMPLFVRAVRSASNSNARLTIEQVRLNPKLSPFIVKDIAAQEGSYVDNVTIIGSSPDGTTVLARGEHGRYKPDGGLIYPMGDGTLYRLHATFKITIQGKGEYQFVGDREDPLIFALIKPLGFVYLGGTGKAILPSSAAIVLPPQNADNYYSLGVFDFNEGEFDAAILDIDKAIELDPNYRKAYAGRAGAYLSKGNYDRAITDCNKAIELDPNLAGAYTIRGAAYSSKRDFRRAMPDYDRAAELDPKNAWAVLYNKALTCDQGGLPQEALLAYRQFLEKAPATETERLENARRRIRYLEGYIDKASGKEPMRR